MIIIGEKINSSIKEVHSAIAQMDELVIANLAKTQFEAGANYIDINAGVFEKDEPEKLAWLTEVVQTAVNAPLSIDSPNPVAIEKALKHNRNGTPIINSISYEKERFNSILPLVLEYKTRVIALCMDDSGMPETAEKRVKIAGSLINDLTQKGVASDDIFIDPMVQPIGTGSHFGLVALETMREVKRLFPEVHIACGLSNISYGLPSRKYINQAFLVAAMAAGMDGAILNPLDNQLMISIWATEALLGKDEYCLNYISKSREGKLG